MTLLYRSWVSANIIDVFCDRGNKTSSPPCPTPTPATTRFLYLQDNKVKRCDVQRCSKSGNQNGSEAILGNFLYPSKFITTIPKTMGNVWWHLNSRSKWFFLSALVKDLPANTHEKEHSSGCQLWSKTARDWIPLPHFLKEWAWQLTSLEI